MKKRMPKVLLVLALVCVLAIGAAVATFAETTGNATVTGDGQWYYSITSSATDTDAGDPVFWVELCDENGDWFTTTSDGSWWIWDDDGTLTWDSNWGTGETWASPAAGDDVIVEITRKDGRIAVSYYINNILSYTAICEGASYTDTVTWQVNIQSGSVAASDLAEGHPVTDARTITNVEVKTLSQDEFIVGSEFDLAGTVLTITYANGDTAELTVGEDWWTYDAYDNGIELYGETEIVEEYYTWTDDAWPNNPIYNAGTYTVMIMTEYYDVINYYWIDELYTTDTTFTVREATREDAASAVPLVLDETYDVTTADQWFAYTPTESGYYIFKTVDRNTYDDNYVTLYVDYGDGTLAFWTNDWYNGDGVLLRCYLEAGYTYYYRTVDCYGDVSVYEVTFTEGKTVASFTVDSLGKTEFTQYIGRLVLSGSVLTVTYTDGTTATFTFGMEGVTDEYGNYFDYCVWGSEDRDYEFWVESGDTLRLDPGTYTVTFYTYDAYDDNEGYVYYADTTQSITVVALADTTETVVIEILDEEYSAEIVSCDRVWYSYTPAEDGYYYIIVDWEFDEDDDNNSCWYYDPRTYDEYGDYKEAGAGYVNGDYWYYNEDTGNSYYIYALEAGVTYYIPTYYYSYDEYGYYVDDASATVTVTMKQIGHEHSYANEVVLFDWTDDYSTATASLRCDNCSHIETTVDCTVTSVTTAATTEAEGSVVYTATAVINGKTYTDEKTVVLDKLTDTASTDPSSGDTDEPTGTNNTTNSSSSTATSTDGDGTGTAPKTGDVATWGYYVLLLGAAAVAVVLAKKKVNA